MKEEIREKVAHQIDLFILGNEWTEESTNKLIDSIGQIMCPQPKPVSGNTENNVENAEKFFFETDLGKWLNAIDDKPTIDFVIKLKQMLEYLVAYASSLQSVINVEKCGWNDTEEGRLQMAAICVMLNSNTEKSYNQNKIERDSPYWTPGYLDACTAMLREIKLIRELQEARFETILFAADYAYRKANPDGKMDTPSMVYEDAEKAYAKWLRSILFNDK